MALPGWTDPVNEPAPENGSKTGLGFGLGLGAQANWARLLAAAAGMVFPL
jgi:hypothetical protein